MKKFIFLYPIPEFIDNEINRGKRRFRDDEKRRVFAEQLESARSELEKKRIRAQALEEVTAEYRELYGAKLNACLSARYRQQGFVMYHAVFDDHGISDVVNVLEEDRIIEVGLNFATHTTKRPDGTYPYPSPDVTLDQVGPASKLVIAGFHMWDCVERLASRAHQRGLDVLVDEDLTDFFTGRLNDPDFQIDKYPTYNPRENSTFKLFMKARENKPWLWQDY